MEWSRYQTAVFEEAARRTQDDCAVLARAGAGKTTSLLEALGHIPYRRVLLCAFNKSIQTELENRAPRNVMTRTLHSLGLWVHRLNCRHRGVEVKVETDKAREQSVALCKEKPQFWRRSEHDYPGRLFEMARHIRKTASFAKNVLADDHEHMLQIAHDQDVDDSKDAERVAAGALELMKRAAREPDIVDFDDMVWMPAHFGYGEVEGTEMLRYDAIMVDEAQDLCAAQHYLVERMRQGGRVISFLDDRQTIYGFRGADKKTIAALLRDDEKGKLPLPISYRCPRSVVQLAQEVVPDIEAAPNAKDGSVTLHEYHELLAGAAPGDFVLSRTNAPLVAICLGLIRRNVPTIIAGRDFGRGLTALIDKSRARGVPELQTWLHNWLEKEDKRHMPDHPARMNRSTDRANCLFVMAESCLTIPELQAKIGVMFDDSDPMTKVVCSTVHKAKGLERDRVWMLTSTFPFPDRIGRRTDIWGEENVWYVAVTRAKSQLFLVDTQVSEITGRPTRRRRKRQVQWR